MVVKELEKLQSLYCAEKTSTSRIASGMPGFPARDRFRLRSLMTRTVKKNFSSDKKFKADLWHCWHCPCIDSQVHIQICPAYHKFREGKDMDNKQDLVEYFRKVIKMRDDMEW